MALEEDPGQTRTEAPTPRRREEARAQGQVANSQDLATGLMLLCGMGALALVGPSMAASLFQGTRSGLLHALGADLDAQRAQSVFADLWIQGLGILGMFLAVVVVAGVFIPILQVGFHVNPGLLGWRLDRLAPAQGLAKLLSGATAMKALNALLRVLVVAGVVWWVMKGRSRGLVGLTETHLVAVAGQSWALIVRLGLAVAGALVTLGLFDYGYQRWRLEQSLRMTRQELKEELKREEGDPMVKARIRKLQRAAAQKRMLQDVPGATVVITNPTHLAVALRYEAGAMPAPKVVAKGAGFVAQRIAALARQHGVPVLERKPLAQALFKAVNVGQEIPAALYLVVAELLAQVYRLRGIVRS